MDPVLAPILKGLSPILRVVGRLAVDWLAGFRSPQAISLLRYQRRLGKTYGTFTPRSGPPGLKLSMQDRYLPLRVEDVEGKKLRIDRAIADHRCLVVIGEPGAGKSMLLHNLLFEFAEGGLAARQANIPVMVELQELTGDVGLDQFLIDQLRLAGFFKPEKFGERLLRKGKLRVLLDGLDEVSQAHRARVVRRICAFVREYANCEVIVTCRTAVREEPLWRAMRVFKVAELDDQLIRRFVGESLAGKQTSIRVLLEALFAVPRVLALARVPLLLAMMVDMYGDGHPVRARFPSSRAQFYRQAADLLLAPTHGEYSTNQERILDKRLILRRLALSCQDSGDGDWLTIDRGTAFAHAEDLFKISNDATRELFNDIIERSGLLRRVDERYRFAHLTFQEYLAAEALSDDANGILRRYRADPVRWQDVVVLWCGITADTADVVDQLRGNGSLVALECLSEVRRVDAELVQRVINTFENDLDRARPDSEVVRAFGAAASGVGGSEVFRYLEEIVSGPGTEARRTAAAHALAASNLSDAAVMLGRLYGQMPEVRAPLERMGDFAVELIASSARFDDATPLDSLVAIGTPAAAYALVDLLWKDDQHVAAHAAWRIGAMITDERTHDALAGYPLPEDARTASDDTRLWQAFTPSQTTRKIMARVGRLIGTGPASAVPKPDRLVVDPRLAMAVGFITVGRPINGFVIDTTDSNVRQLKSIVRQMSQVSGSNGTLKYENALTPGMLQVRADERWTQLQSRLFELHLQRMNWGKREQALLGQVPPRQLADLFRRYQSRAPSLDEWAHMHATGPGMWPVVLALASVTVAEIAGLVVLACVLAVQAFFPPTGFTLQPFTEVLPVLRWLVSVWRGLIGLMPDWLVLGISTQWIIGALLTVALGVLILRVLAALASQPLLSVIGMALGTAVVLLIVAPTARLHTVLGSWWAVIFLWLTALAVPLVGYFLARLQTSRDNSPIRGGLQASEGSSRTLPLLLSRSREGSS